MRARPICDRELYRGERRATKTGGGSMGSLPMQPRYPAAIEPYPARNNERSESSPFPEGGWCRCALAFSAGVPADRGGVPPLHGQVAHATSEKREDLPDRPLRQPADALAYRGLVGGAAQDFGVLGAVDGDQAGSA